MKLYATYATMQLYATYATMKLYATYATICNLWMCDIYPPNATYECNYILLMALSSFLEALRANYDA